MFELGLLGFVVLVTTLVGQRMEAARKRRGEREHYEGIERRLRERGDPFEPGLYEREIAERQKRAREARRKMRERGAPSLLWVTMWTSIAVCLVAMAFDVRWLGWIAALVALATLIFGVLSDGGGDGGRGDYGPDETVG